MKWNKQCVNIMADKIINKTIYKKAQYNVRTNCDILKTKYHDIYSLKFILKDLGENIFGKKFLGNFPKSWDFNKHHVVVRFLARMSAMGKNVFNKDDVIVYGKAFTTHAGMGNNELMLLSELELPLSIKELTEFKNKNKIKILTI